MPSKMSSAALWKPVATGTIGPKQEQLVARRGVGRPGHRAWTGGRSGRHEGDPAAVHEAHLGPIEVGLAGSGIGARSRGLEREQHLEAVGGDRAAATPAPREYNRIGRGRSAPERTGGRHTSGQGAHPIVAEDRPAERPVVRGVGAVGSAQGGELFGREPLQRRRRVAAAQQAVFPAVGADQQRNGSAPAANEGLRRRFPKQPSVDDDDGVALIGRLQRRPGQGA